MPRRDSSNFVTGNPFLEKSGICFCPQTKILRLFKKEIQRVVPGSRRSRPGHARLTRTWRNGKEEIIREDLYYRLSAFGSRPPARTDGGPDWSTSCSKGSTKRPGTLKSQGSHGVMEKYNWPGSVRELETLFIPSVVSKGKRIRRTCPARICRFRESSEDSNLRLPHPRPNLLLQPNRSSKATGNATSLSAFNPPKAIRSPLARVPFPPKGYDIAYAHAREATNLLEVVAK